MLFVFILCGLGAALFLAVVGREERTALYLAICLLTACAFTAPMLRRLRGFHLSPDAGT